MVLRCLVICAMCAATTTMVQRMATKMMVVLRIRNCAIPIQVHTAMNVSIAKTIVKVPQKTADVMRPVRHYVRPLQMRMEQAVLNVLTINQVTNKIRVVQPLNQCVVRAMENMALSVPTAQMARFGMMLFKVVLFVMTA